MSMVGTGSIDTRTDIPVFDLGGSDPIYDHAARNHEAGKNPGHGVLVASERGWIAVGSQH